MPSSNEPTVVLYTLKGAWDLPSLSPGCIQAEAYLRMADISFAVDALKSGGTSPTGALPAVQSEAGFGGQTPDLTDDFAASSAAIAFLQEKHVDIDKTLSAAEAAHLAAFTCLVDNQLNDAVRYSMWCEWRSFWQLPDLFGRTLPWPLSYIIPYTQSVSVRRRLKKRDPAQLYAEGERTIKALESWKAATPQSKYLFGNKPCSLDAKVYGLLAYISGSPIVAPVLKSAVQNAPALTRYIAGVAETFFKSSVPSWTDCNVKTSWSAAANGSSASDVVDTPDEKRRRRNSWIWLGVTGALVASFLGSGVLLADIELSELVANEEEEEADGE